MQDNPVEAVRNNALATRALTDDRGRPRRRARSCSSRPTRRSRPATVMGASKALAEWAVEAANARYEDTAFCAVRFGNVLGSSGSVVPIFRRQIRNGGPVTVTDPEMTRFFMTIPEAVQLVIRSGSLAQGGEVYALEMGEPVRIMDLAERHDPLLGPRARSRHRDRDHRRAAAARSCTSSCSTPTSGPSRRPRRRSCAPRARPSIPAWVEYVFDKVGLLVAEGDAAGLAAAVAELAGGRSAVVEASAESPAHPAS